MSAAESTVVVVGVGDLGGRIFDALARCDEIGRLVAAGRDPDRIGPLAAQAALIAQLTGGPPRVEAARIDLRDTEATARTLAELAPDVVVTAATEYSWWRGARVELPYAGWLPLQLPLVRSLMQARAAGAPDAHVVSLPFPDATGPILAAEGLAPTVGAGNVAEVAAKLALLAGDGADVRLVMHHAAERVALSAFAGVAGGAAEPGEPPWIARVADLDPARVDELFHAPYPLPDGRATHDLTAAATVAVVAGLLSEAPVRAHVPAPLGLPGGYPVTLSRSGVELDLPAGVTREEAIAVNVAAGAWDGIEEIGADGTVQLTDAAGRALSATLGSEVHTIAPADHEPIAAALRQRAF